MITDYLSYSLKNLKSRRMRSWLTMIGIIIGIASVVSLIGLGEGLRNAISGQFGNFGTDLLSVMASGGFGPPGTGVVDPLETDYINQIENLKEIDGAAGRLIEAGKAKYNKKVVFGYAVSMPDGDGRDLIERAAGYEAENGRMLKDTDSGSVFIGYDVAQEETFGKEVRVGSRIKVNDKSFKVVGIAEKIGNFMFDSSILINEDEFRDLLDRNDDSYDVIVAQINPGVTIEESQSAVEKLLRRIRDVKKGEENFEVQNPQSVIDDLNSTMFAVQLFVYIIASISLIVGGIGIMTTMFTSVVERTKEIGIMKSIGARNNTIFVLFFIESGFLGMVGGIIGIILGASAAYGLASAGSALLGSNLIQAHLSLSVIIGSLIFSFILGSVFGTLPAHKASRMHPVDALRFVK